MVPHSGLTCRSCDGRAGEFHGPRDEEPALSPAGRGAEGGGIAGTLTGVLSCQVTDDGSVTIKHQLYLISHMYMYYVVMYIVCTVYAAL